MNPAATFTNKDGHIDQSIRSKNFACFNEKLNLAMPMNPNTALDEVIYTEINIYRTVSAHMPFLKF